MKYRVAKKIAKKYQMERFIGDRGVKALEQHTCKTLLKAVLVLRRHWLRTPDVFTGESYICTRDYFRANGLAFLHHRLLVFFPRHHGVRVFTDRTDNKTVVKQSWFVVNDLGMPYMKGKIVLRKRRVKVVAK